MSGTSLHQGRLPASLHWLNAAQTLGALNDNLFKLFLIYFATRTVGTDALERTNAAAAALFAIPFLLFSPLAGVLADRFSKQRVMLVAKLAGLIVLGAGVVGFHVGSVTALYGVMFLLAAHSAFFGPSRSGIIPELVGIEGLSKANAILQSMSFLGIIGGMVLAPMISRLTGENATWMAVCCVGIATAEVLAIGQIAHTPPSGRKARPSLFVLNDVIRTLRSIRSDRELTAAVLGVAAFMAVAAYMQANFVAYGVHAFGLSAEAATYLFVFAALGIAAGALVAGRMSGRNVELGVVPLGIAILMLALFALGIRPPVYAEARVLVFTAGMGTGLFIVPLQSWIQFRSPHDRRGEILAASGFLGWIGVCLGAALIYTLDWCGVSPQRGFIVIACVTLSLSALTFSALPDFLVRFLAVTVTRVCYRLRVIGQPHVPVTGPALLVCNHVSWVDPLLLLATMQRRIRFIADQSSFDRPWLAPWLRLMGVIRVRAAHPGRETVRAIQSAREALDQGFLVCIFAEGAITTTGHLQAFKGGFSRIIDGSEHPVIPTYIGGMWGSVFSYRYGWPRLRIPVHFPYPATVIFGRPHRPDVAVHELRLAVQELATAYYEDKRSLREPLPRTYVRVARMNWGRIAISDTSGKAMTHGEALVAALLLAKRLRNTLMGQAMVGILLPPSVGAVLCNLAVAFLGKTSVNLNYTSSRDSLASAMRQCDMKTVITSPAFLEKLGFATPQGALFLEPVMKELHGDHAGQRKSWLKAKLFPATLLAPDPAAADEEAATIIFSSGSTGEPKGVMLSHHNIMSNVEALQCIFRADEGDGICAVLPFFHSFGYTATLWYPLLSGARCIYHVNPLDGGTIADLVRENEATILFSTPTFLMSYVRKAKPEDFKTLKLVICGAEKLRARVADAFHERFGIRPLEGYGATELSPVAALNIPDVTFEGRKHTGNKEGTVGHPIPGVAVKIVDTETGAVLPPGQSGLMLIKGPNVMLGYLGRPEKTAELIKDGWYNTGDIAKLDGDGFITITDRLSRFSKIAGEMVPHLGVEDAIQQALGKGGGQVLVVTSVPDEKKGEKLVVLFTDDAGTVADLQKAAATSTLPNLWKPAPDAYIRVEAIPLLGSGKLDLKQIKEMARAQLMAQSPAVANTA